MADPSSASTPLMRQYAAVKKEHPGALVLFRLGDFYELFFEDAVLAARELQITLTSRNKEKGIAVPMCGVPYHSAENYIAKLIKKGYRVAICDQMEDPKVAKTLVRREVTRVLTPGTASLQPSPDESNYLAAIARGGGPSGPRAGLALLELSTGDFRVTEFSGPHAEARLQDELDRWRPREILYASESPLFADRPARANPGDATLTPIEDWIFSPDFARRVLETHFGVLSLEGYGLRGDRELAAAAAGAVIHYVKETQRSRIAHVDRIGFYERSDGLLLDAVSARNLELVDSIFAESDQTTLRAVLDEAVTPMGKRLLRLWLLRPSADRIEIEARLGAVECLYRDWQVRERLRRTLAGVLDLERLLSRVALETAGPRDLVALKSSLDHIPELRDRLAELEPDDRLLSIKGRLDDLGDLRRNIGATIVEEPPASLADGNCIRAGVDAELDDLRMLARNSREVIAQIEARERARTGIGSLKVRFNNIFGYFIEVSKPNLPNVPADYERKQTLVNAERFTTPELKSLEARILTAEEKIAIIERRIFETLRAAAAAESTSIRQTAGAVGQLDLLANFAHIAGARRYVRPRISARDTLEIRAGRHPVVEKLGLEGAADRFVANDAHLDNDANRVLLITGPNMGGKSTYLRQIALMAVMAQMGCFVPAESAELPIFDRIFTRIGASDNLARGRSTFMVEMMETASILNGATAHSLVILDEVGRGTSTYDGLALAWAVVEYLHDRVGAKTLFATHYHELTELADYLPAVRNLQVSVKETPGGIVFLRKVEPGAASRSYGIEVGRLAGLPSQITDRAREVLRTHERAERRAGEQLESAAAQAAESPRANLDAAQLTIFTPLSQQIVDRLAAADLDRLTPLDALNLLSELQRQIGSSGE